MLLSITVQMMYSSRRNSWNYSLTIAKTPKLCLGVELCVVVTGNKPKFMVHLCFFSAIIVQKILSQR